METQINEIEINGKEYILKELVQEEITGDIKIVILQRGWNIVGIFEKDGDNCKLHKASVIRCWGTKQGLGEIALGGPTQNTVLDKCYGLVEFDRLTVVATIACKEDKWKNHL